MDKLHASGGVDGRADGYGLLNSHLYQIRRKKRTRKPRRAMKERVPPRQMGSIAISKGPYLEPISVLFSKRHQRRPEKASGHKEVDLTFKDGTRATSRHVS